MSIDEFMDGAFLDLIDMRGRKAQLDTPLGMPSTSKPLSAGPRRIHSGGQMSVVPGQTFRLACINRVQPGHRQKIRETRSGFTRIPGL
jgi:hypothetical protein